jgi:hypothetical protein
MRCVYYNFTLFEYFFSHCRSRRKADFKGYGRMLKIMMVSSLVGLQSITVTVVRGVRFSREAGMHDWCPGIRLGYHYLILQHFLSLFQRELFRKYCRVLYLSISRNILHVIQLLPAFSSWSPSPLYSTFLSIACFRTQFTCSMWPI